MIRAKVIEAFPGVPDGQTRPKKFREYDEVTGDLAEVAVREGWAELINGEAELDDEPRNAAWHRRYCGIGAAAPRCFVGGRLFTACRPVPSAREPDRP